MSDQIPTEEALLDKQERELLTKPDCQSEKTRDELVSQLQDRFRRTLNDIKILYMTLTDDEIKQLFGESDGTQGAIRANGQHVWAFLYYGLQLTDDDINHRIASAIKQAEAANDRDAAVTLDIVTQPFMPPEQFMQTLEGENSDPVSAEMFDRLWYDDRFSKSDVVDIAAAVGERGLTTDDVATAREKAANFERIPSTVITNVEVASTSSTENEN